jgi:hypothetical protein
MSNGYSRGPKLLKGALIQFSAPLLIPIPNLIIFQYNPETLSRYLTPWTPPAKDDKGNVDEKTRNQLSQPYDPQESFTLNLEVDATDALEEPSSHPIAVISGVADRLSAMEMLLYPPGGSTLGGLLNVSVSVSLNGGPSIGGAASAEKIAVKRSDVPIVLFFWGPGRIVPVRITSFNIEEQQFSPLLYPIRAKVSLGVNVLDTIAFDKQEQTAIVKIAKACYTFTRAQKEALALANLANSIESIAGMLPF